MKSIYRILIGFAIVFAVSAYGVQDFKGKQNVVALDGSVFSMDLVVTYVAAVDALYFAEEAGMVAFVPVKEAKKPSKGYASLPFKPPLSSQHS